MWDSLAAGDGEECGAGRCLVRTCDAAAAADSGRLLRQLLRRTSRDKVSGRREDR